MHSGKDNVWIADEQPNNTVDMKTIVHLVPTFLPNSAVFPNSTGVEFSAHENSMKWGFPHYTQL